MTLVDMEKYKPPFECNKCPEESFTRKTSAKRHVDKQHTWDSQIFDSNGKLVTFDNASKVGKSKMINKDRSLGMYIEERIRERARLDERAFYNVFDASEGYLQHIFRLSDNLSDVPSDLREMLYLDLASGKLNWTLGFHALIFSLKLDVRSTESKIEELTKLRGNGNELARLKEELTDYRRRILEFEDQLKELTKSGYAIGISSRRLPPRQNHSVDVPRADADARLNQNRPQVAIEQLRELTKANNIENEDMNAILAKAKRYVGKKPDQGTTMGRRA